MDKKAGPPIKRRHFLIGMSAVAAASSIPLVISCSPENKTDIHGQLDQNQLATLEAVQEHLFPAGKKSPGAKDINATLYFTWVLSDKDKDPEERKFMRNGIQWTNETAQESYSLSFTKLDHAEKENVLQIMANESWGENWISVVLTFIFEALLSDPIYGSNTNEVGWNWLEHQSGYPRATEENKYLPGL